MANKIRQLREERGLTQQQLADLSGLARDRISMLESGKIKKIQGKTKLKLATALGVSPTYFDSLSAQPEQSELTNIIRKIPKRNEFEEVRAYRDRSKVYLEKHPDNRLQYFYDLGIYTHFISEDDVYIIYDSNELAVYSIEGKDMFEDVIKSYDEIATSVILAILKEFKNRRE